MSFAREKHVRYWRMCAQSLPAHYISNDSSRMTLGFFIVSALDLLGALDDIDLRERQSWISWVYDCQAPEGGFRGFTGTILKNSRSDDNCHWDPPNIPATFFALGTLLVLGDDLSRVKRQECLTWLPKLQRDDGSFGELLSQNGVIEGDQDLRQCCCAAGIAYMLQEHPQEHPSFSEQKLVSYIQSCQSLDGGFGVSPLRESHSGLSYCAIEALSFIQKLHGQATDALLRHIPDADQCVKWFLERQTNIIDDDDGPDGDEETVHKDENSPSQSYQKINLNSIVTPLDIQVAGFNGRACKVADTCYAFWNAGALAILGRQFLVDSDAMKRYLLEVTQHRIGGFGKGRDDPPDVLHSYLGLAALGLFGHPEVKALDPTMCISLTSAARLDTVRWKQGTTCDAISSLP